MPNKSFRRRPYTATPNEAHLPAEEAEAGEDPRIPGTDEHPRRPGDPQAPPPQRPEAPDRLDGGETTSSAPLAQRRVRPGLPRRLFERDPLPGPLCLPPPGRWGARREARRLGEPQGRRRRGQEPRQARPARSVLGHGRPAARELRL